MSGAPAEGEISAEVPQRMQSRAVCGAQALSKLFPGNQKLFFPVVHCRRGECEHAVHQTSLALEAGADGVFLICMSKEPAQVYLELYFAVRASFPDSFVGINFLGMTPAEAMAAAPDDCSAIWTDTGVASQVDPTLPQMEQQRASRAWSGLHFGGFFHKGPGRPTFTEPLSESHCSLIDDGAALALDLLDVPVVTGPRTGHLIEPHVLEQMHAGLGSAKIATASGISFENIHQVLPMVDIFMVASSLEAYETFDQTDSRHCAWLQDQDMGCAAEEATQLDMQVPLGFDPAKLMEMAETIHQTRVE